MTQNVSQFEVTVQNLVVKQVVEAVYALAKDLDGLLLSQVPSLLDIRVQVAVVAVLQDQVVVVGGLLHVVELDDVMGLAALQNLYLGLKQLLKLACLVHFVPLTFSRRIDFTAMSLLVARS